LKSRTSLLIGASLGVAAGSLLSKVLGFIREMVIAARFGASAQVDAYVVASTVPTVIFGGVGGALGAVVVPVFTRRRVSLGEREAFRVAVTIWNSVLILGLAVVAVGEIAMPIIVRAMAPGYGGDVLSLTIALGRIMMPVALFTTLGLLARGMLHSLQVFALPSLGDPLQNVVVVSSVLALGGVLGIRGLALGVLAGSAAQICLFLPALIRRGFYPSLRLERDLPELREVVALSVPILAGSGLGSLGVFVERVLASTLPEGSVAAMSYATRVYTLPMAFAGTALTTVIYPTLAELAAADQVSRLTDGLKRGLSVAALALFPMAAGMMVLAEPITRVVYQRGAFDREATLLTAGVLTMYALGIPALSWRDVAGRAFYASGDTCTPLWATGVALAVNVSLNLVLVRVMGAMGLALSAALSWWVGAFCVMWLWDRRLSRGRTRDTWDGHPGAPGAHGGLPCSLADRRFFVEVCKILAATVLMSAAVYMAHGIARAYVGGGSALSALLRLCLSVLIGAVSYGAAVWLLRVEEFRFLVKVVQAGFRRRLRVSARDGGR